MDNPIVKTTLKASAFAVALVAMGGQPVRANQVEIDDRVTQFSVGPIFLGATVGEARANSPSLTFRRGGGPENSIVIDVFEGDTLLMSLFTQEQIEYDDQGNAPPIDDDAIITGIDIVDPRFMFSGMVHVGVEVSKAARTLGLIKTMRNAPHEGEVPTFERQPGYMSFAVSLPQGIAGNSGTAGIYKTVRNCDEDNPWTCKEATRVQPGTIISRMSVSLGSGQPEAITEITGLAPGYRVLRTMPAGEACDGGDPIATPVATYAVWQNYPESNFFNLIEVEGPVGCPDESGLVERRNYAEQHEVVLDDFNFDGRLDLALYNGNLGGYSSPSYNVYFFDEPSGTYVLNEPFSDLTLSLGMFVVDEKARRLYVDSKSGATWYQRTGYIVAEGNQLLTVYEETTEYGPDGKGTVTTRELIDGEWKSSIAPVDE